MEGSDDLIVSMDGQGWLIYVNRASEKLLGFSPEECIGRNARDMIHQDDLDRAIEKYILMMRDGTFCGTIEARLIARDGCIHHIAWTVNCHRDDRGMTTGISAIGRDITRLKHAEKALARREHDFRTLVATSDDGMIVLDRDGRIKYVNPAAEALFGLPAAGMEGECFGFPLLHDTPVRMYILREHESFVAVEMHLTEVEWDGERSHLVTLRNLTDRILAHETMRQVRKDLEAKIERRVRELSRLNERLRESEERFATAFHTTTTGFVLARASDWTLVDANQAILDITGFCREDVFRQDLREMDIYVDREAAKKTVMERLLKDGSIQAPELRIRRKDGQIRIISMDCRLFTIRGRKYYLATAYDITERKQADMELKTAKAQAELYLDLMGHDINNMHQIALGYLELATELEENEQMRELLARPRDVLLRSARLIDNVRKLQKLKDGVYRPRPVELKAVLSDVLREYEAVPGKALKLYTQGYDPCYVEANDLLYDVFANLVSNAIKHSGMRAQVAISLGQVDEVGRQYYRVAVEDNGQGIPDNFKEKIFNRMLQGDDKAKGMGLGLFIVKTLVEGYGGSVWVEDRVSGDHRKGAKFVVQLPALHER